MNKLIFLTSFILFTFSLSADEKLPENQFCGKIAGAKKEKLYLFHISGNKLIKVDSTVTKNSGKFKFKSTLPEIDFYKLGFSRTASIPMILEGGEKVSLKASRSTFPKYYTTEGSDNTKLIGNYDSYIHTTNKHIKRLDSLSKSDKGNAYKYKEQSDSIRLSFVKYRNAFIQENKGMLATMYATKDLDPKTDLKQYKEIYSGIKVTYPSTKFAKFLKDAISQLDKKSSGQLGVGDMAPELNFPSPSGEVITLESLRGKYVLIDFWASWCGPCRRENPTVVKLYDKYKKKGFEVYSVSLDRNKASWEAAIKKDNLKWKSHVSDLKQWRSAAVKKYQFRGIPYTVLIDREGRIVATRLRGSALHNKLLEIFGE